MHLHTYRVQVGSQTQRFCGFKTGSTAIIEERNELIIDGVANMQISGNVEMDILHKLSNDGILYIGGNAHGSIGSLTNGIFTSIGRTPEAYAFQLPTFASHPFHPGGDICVAGSMVMHIPCELENRGFVHAGGVMHIGKPRSFLNERRVTEESTSVTKKSKFKSTSRSVAPRDHLEPGGVVSGGNIELTVGHGINRGGEIHSSGDGYLYAAEFHNEALALRRFVSLYPGAIMPWQKSQGYSIATDFVPASIISGGAWTHLSEGVLRNIGSNMVSFGDMTVIAGCVDQRTLFSSHKALEKRTLTSSKDIYDIQMQEASLYSIDGSMSVKSTKEDISLEGVCGSVASDTTLESARSLYLNAQTTYVENSASGLQFTPTTITYSNLCSSSAKTSIPKVFGANVNFSAVDKIDGVGTEIHANKDLNAKAASISFVDHVVDHYQKNSGFTIGATFFGSNALECVYKGGSPKDVGIAILAEDPAFRCAMDLAKARLGAEVAFHALKTAVHTWNEVSSFAKAYNQGDLTSAIGSHFGVTHNGEFDPRITLRLGAFNQSQSFQSSMPTYLMAQGCIHFEATDQYYRGIEVPLVGAGATLIGDRICFEAPHLRSSSNGSTCGLSLSFGNGAPINIGIDGSRNWMKALSRPSTVIDFGPSLNIPNCKELTLDGIAIDADVINVSADRTMIRSALNSQEGGAWSASASTSGALSGSEQSISSASVDRPAGLYARLSDFLKGGALTLVGGVTQNVDVSVTELSARSIELWHEEEKIGFSLNVAACAKIKEHGALWLGEMQVSSSKRYGTVQASIAGSNTGSFGLNADLKNTVIYGKEKKSFIGVPLVSFNRELLELEKNQIKTAFSSPMPRNNRVQASRGVLTSSEILIDSIDGPSDVRLQKKENRALKKSALRDSEEARDEKPSLETDLGSAARIERFTLLSETVVEENAEEESHVLDHVLKQMTGAIFLKKWTGRNISVVSGKHVAKKQHEKRDSAVALKGGGEDFLHQMIHTHNALDADLSSVNPHSHAWNDSESYEFDARDQRLEQMAVVGGLNDITQIVSFTVWALGYPFIEGAKHAFNETSYAIDIAAEVCKKQPMLHSAYKKAASVATGTKRFVVSQAEEAKNHISMITSAGKQVAKKAFKPYPKAAETVRYVGSLWHSSADRLERWWDERQHAISILAKNNEVELGIPRGMTQRMFQDADELAVTAGISLVTAGTGTALKSIVRKTPIAKKQTPLYGEILAPGDTRGLFAKDVTSGYPLISGPAGLYNPRLLPVVIKQSPSTYDPRLLPVIRNLAPKGAVIPSARSITSMSSAQVSSKGAAKISKTSFLLLGLASYTMVSQDDAEHKQVKGDHDYIRGNALLHAVSATQARESKGEEYANLMERRRQQSDGSIEPSAYSLFERGLRSVSKATSKFTKNICADAYMLRGVCNRIDSAFPNVIKDRRPKALILTASKDSDYNNALDLSHGGWSNVKFLKKIEQLYNTKYVRIFDKETLCKAIDIEKMHGNDVELLVIRAHGSRTSMDLDIDEELSVYSYLPTDSCLKNLAPEVTIISQSCSTGEGGATGHNVANRIAEFAPPDARIFAASDRTNGFSITQEKPLEVRHELTEASVLDSESPDSVQLRDVTYKIESAKKYQDIWADTKPPEGYVEKKHNSYGCDRPDVSYWNDYGF